MKKKLISMLLASAMVATMLAGCGSKEEAATSEPAAETKAEEKAEEPAEEAPAEEAADEEIVQLTWTWVNGNYEESETWPTEAFNDLNEALREKFGVELVMKGVTTEEFDLMLASDTFLGDIVKPTKDYTNRLIEIGQMVNFDDYADLVPNVLNFGDGTRAKAIRSSVSNGTDGFYWWTPAVGKETAGVDIWNGFTIRWDWYKELGYPEVTNEDEYLEVVKQIVEAHPTNENGDKVHGLATFTDGGLWGWWVMGGRVGQHNISDIYMWDYLEQKVVNNITDTTSALWTGITMAYKANQLGIFDPDSFTMTGSDLNAKATNGQIVAPCCTWYGGSLYSNSLAEDPESLSGYMVLPVEGASHWMGQTSPAGWNFYTGCNADSEHIEKVLQVFDYLHTEEGARMAYVGKEGRAWEMVDGVPQITAEYLDIYLNADANERTVKCDPLNGQFTGYSQTADLSDGLPANLWKTAQVYKETLNPMQKDYCALYGVDYPAQKAEQMVEEGKAFDQRNAGAIVAAMGQSPDDIARIDTRQLELVITKIPELVLAADDTEFERLQQELIDEAYAAGAQDSIDWWEAEVEAIKERLK